MIVASQWIGSTAEKMMADGSWIETEDGRYTSYYLIAGEADDREQAYAIGFDDLSGGLLDSPV